MHALLCMGTAGLWVRSYRVRDTLQYAKVNREPLQMSIRQLFSDKGALVAFEWHFEAAEGPRSASSPSLTPEGWSYSHLEPNGQFREGGSIAKRLGFHAWYRLQLSTAVSTGIA